MLNFYHKFISIIFLVFYSSVSLGQTLNDVLAIAYENNDELKMYRNDFLNEIEQLPQALSGFLPNIVASIDQISSKRKMQSNFSNSKTESDNVQKSLTIEQPMFNSGSSVAALRSAQAAARSSIGKYYESEQKILLDVINAYLSYIAAKEKLRVAEISVNNNAKQLEAVQEQLKVGQTIESEVASAQAALSNAETNKLTAYANLQATQSSFLSLVGVMPPEDAAMPDIPKNLPKTLEELLKKSENGNYNIYQIRNAITSYKANEHVAKAALLPQLNFRVDVGSTAYEPEIRNDINRQNFGSVTSRLSLQIPIYTRGGVEYSKVRQAKNSTRKILHQLDLVIKKNHAQSIAVWESFIASSAKISSATKGVEAAQIAYDAVREEEKVGSKSIIDILAVEDKLNKAQIDKIEAHKDYILASYQIKMLTGDLTARRLNLKTNYFIPEKEIKSSKMKIIGF